MDFIRLNKHITLSEITPKDIDSFVEFLNEKEIYINTLTIPFPYTKENSEWFVSFVKKNKKEHGRIINWAIRNKGIMSEAVKKYVRLVLMNLD
jgi:RimJ/RimL family protein N-acetyltransferase